MWHLSVTNKSSSRRCKSRTYELRAYFGSVVENDASASAGRSGAELPFQKEKYPSWPVFHVRLFLDVLSALAFNDDTSTQRKVGRVHYRVHKFCGLTQPLEHIKEV